MPIVRCVFLSLAMIVSLVCFPQKKASFTNPLLPSGADPWSIYKDGFYYYTHTVGDRLVIWKTKTLADLKTATSKTIFKPPPGTGYSKGLWAPELHFIDNKWYMYFAADSGRNESHRLWVLENVSGDPMEGDWVLKGKIGDSTNKWAIDASVFQYKGELYMIWSGWEGDHNGRQDIYIGKMKTPWAFEGPRIRLSSPTLEWETHGNLNDNNNPAHVAVNEGPQFLQKGNRIFLIYSASGCWTDFYALGMLSLKEGGNLLDSTSWIKNLNPVFKQSVENGVYAPGHNSFFKSPDGTEDWILYHANSAPGQGCGKNRSPRAQKFTWNKDGTPNFGEPIKPGVLISVPSNRKHIKKRLRHLAN